MKVHYNGTGKVVRVDRVVDEVRYPGIPAGTTLLEFDEDANAEVAQQILDNPNRFVVAGGVLQRDGVNVSLATDSAKTTRRKQARQIIAALEAGTATSNQAQRAIAFLLRQHFQEES